MTWDPGIGGNGLRVRCFLDTEYSDTTQRRPISVALVAEDGREYYAEVADGWTPADCSEFVIRNVLPHLCRSPDVIITRAAIRETLPRWLSSLGGPATITYDLRADWSVLSALFDDLPNRFGIHGRLLRWGDPAMEERFARRIDAWYEANGPRHNALVDARGLRACVLAVEKEFGRRVFE